MFAGFPDPMKASASPDANPEPGRRLQTAPGRISTSLRLPERPHPPTPASSSDRLVCISDSTLRFARHLMLRAVYRKSAGSKKAMFGSFQLKTDRAGSDLHTTWDAPGVWVPPWLYPRATFSCALYQSRISWPLAFHTPAPDLLMCARARSRYLLRQGQPMIQG
jgi:hypothetical protein